LIKLTGNHKKGLVSLLKQTAVFDLIMAWSYRPRHFSKIWISKIWKMTCILAPRRIWMMNKSSFERYSCLLPFPKNSFILNVFTWRNIGLTGSHNEGGVGGVFLPVNCHYLDMVRRLRDAQEFVRKVFYFLIFSQIFINFVHGNEGKPRKQYRNRSGVCLIVPDWAKWWEKKKLSLRRFL
jgi:hypothetical protein